MLLYFLKLKCYFDSFQFLRNHICMEKYDENDLNFETDLICFVFMRMYLFYIKLQVYKHVLANANKAFTTLKQQSKS